MTPTSSRNLQLLSEIASGRPITQRELAKRGGLALGLVHALMHRLIDLGYVQAVAVTPTRLLYRITEQGLQEHARLAQAHLEESLATYRALRVSFARALAPIVTASQPRVVLCGTGDAAEIASLILQRHGVAPSAIVDDGPGCPPWFLGHRVHRLSDLSTLTVDWAVVAAPSSAARFLEALARTMIPKERILVVPKPVDMSARGFEPAESALATVELAA